MIDPTAPSRDESVSILVNPLPTAEVRNQAIISNGGTESPTGTESPGTSQMSPPPSYFDIPGNKLVLDLES